MSRYIRYIDHQCHSAIIKHLAKCHIVMASITCWVSAFIGNKVVVQNAIFNHVEHIPMTSISLSRNINQWYDITAD